MDKLESGIVALETEYGPVYVQPSGWERLYLLWTFRHFNSLPLKTLNSRQRKLVERLPRCGARRLRSGLDRMQVIGTVEGAKTPSFLITQSSESTMDAESTEVVFVATEFLAPVPSGLCEKSEDLDEVPTIQLYALSAQKRLGSRIASILATGALSAVVAVTAWHWFQPTRTSKIASVSVSIPNTGSGFTEVAIQATNQAPIEASVNAIAQSDFNQISHSAVVVPPSSLMASVPGPRQPIATPAALISPLESKVGIPAKITATPTNDNTNKIQSKENPVLGSVQEGAVQKDTPRIEFSGPPQRLIYPDYPDTKVRGKVNLRAVIGEDGKVREVKILSGNKVLSAAAAQAIRKWRYDPFYKDGQPVETETNVSVLFVSADVISLSFPSTLPISR